MFFYSPNPHKLPLSVRRATLSPNVAAAHLDSSRLSVQIAEALSRHDETHYLELEHWPLEVSPTSSVFSTSESRRASRALRINLRRPTISIQEDGKILIGVVFGSFLGRRSVVSVCVCRLSVQCLRRALNVQVVRACRRPSRSPIRRHRASRRSTSSKAAYSSSFFFSSARPRHCKAVLSCFPLLDLPFKGVFA